MNMTCSEVLAYHRISRIPLPSGTWVRPGTLGRQMDLLLDSGVTIADPCQWSPRENSGVLLTFDDGTIDLIEMGGVLARRGLRGMVFVPSDFLGRVNSWEWGIPGRRILHMNAQQLAMLADLGWEIGLHGASHKDLLRMDPVRLLDEISGGRQRLEKAIGRPVRFFSYPFGRCQGHIKNLLQEEGFEAAFVMARAGQTNFDAMAIPRRPVYCIDTPGDVLTKVMDPEGRTLGGRWQHFKERGAHSVGRITAGWKKQGTV